ncbi:MAG: hypothetical protein IT340_20100 [Chloroflexi bacterium]|nr:hypothetical protein [Chloroflexota bacterium]
MARQMGGDLYRGLAGDVDAHGYRVEVKSSEQLRGYGRLRAHLDQAIANGATAAKPWLLAVTGGKTYRNGQVFTVLPLDDLVSLLTTAATARLTQSSTLSLRVREHLRAALADLDQAAAP